MFIQLFSICFDVTWCGLMLDPLQTKYTKGFQTARAYGWFFWRHFSSSQSPACRKSSKICWQRLKRPGTEARRIQMDARQGLTAEVIECLHFSEKYFGTFHESGSSIRCAEPWFLKVSSEASSKTWAIRIDPVDSEWFRCVVDVCNINISVMMCVFFSW